MTSRIAREKCYSAKSIYFNCLDTNNLWLSGLNPKSYQEIINVNPADESLINLPSIKCLPEFSRFKESCLNSWVVHFSLLRVKDLQTDAIREKIIQDEIKSKSDGFWK